MSRFPYPREPASAVEWEDVIDARAGVHSVGLFGPSHSAILRSAQTCGMTTARKRRSPSGRRLAQFAPKTVATDALIIASLAVYSSDLGDPLRGLALLTQVPLDDVRRLTGVHLICLASRCSCRAAAGDLEGARRDRDVIRAKDPHHPALLLADSALNQR